MWSRPKRLLNALMNRGYSVLSLAYFKDQGLLFLVVEFKRSDWWSFLTLRRRKKAEAALRNEAGVEEAAIPVEDRLCPVLLLSGSRDQVWPTTMMCDQIVRRLEEARYPYPYEHVSYNAGHIGLARNKDCWRKALSFLDTHFEARPAIVWD